MTDLSDGSTHRLPTEQTLELAVHGLFFTLFLFDLGMEAGGDFNQVLVDQARLLIASCSGTEMMSVPRSAAIQPKTPWCTMSMVPMP